MATKYEEEGKFQKSVITDIIRKPVHGPQKLPQFQKVQEADTTSVKPKFPILVESLPLTYENKSMPESMPVLQPEHKSILERIAKELIRAEVLNCIHNEQLNAKVDIGVGTSTESLELVAAKNNRHESLKLSTISEELQIMLTTPELTPPPSSPKKEPKVLNRVESVENSKYETLNTPELTPPRKILIPVFNSKRTPPENNNDLTDCSSISDFVFSEIVKIPTPQKSSKHGNLVAVSPDMKTPEISPQLSRHSKYEHTQYNQVSNSVHVQTPAPSTSASAVRFTLPEKSSRERSISSQSSKSKTGAETSQNLSEEKTKTNSKLEKSDIIKSKFSATDISSELESRSSMSSAFRHLCTEMASEGEFLGIPNKSPGEVSWSISLSPGINLSNEEVESDSNSSMESQSGLSEDVSQFQNYMLYK